MFCILSHQNAHMNYVCIYVYSSGIIEKNFFFIFPFFFQFWEKETSETGRPINRTH